MYYHWGCTTVRQLARFALQGEDVEISITNLVKNNGVPLSHWNNIVLKDITSAFWADGEVHESTITSTKGNRGSLHKRHRENKKNMVVESSNFIRGENLRDSDAEGEEDIDMEVWKTLV
jgi:hypothetical protein